MVATTAERWTAMRILHETFGVGLELLSQATGRSAAMLAARMRNEKWLTPSAAHTGRGAVLGRMSAMLETQLVELESHMKDGEGADEKSVRTLGTMARTWEKLNALEQLMDKELDDRQRALVVKQDAVANLEPGDDDAALHELRLELERRIAALVERKSCGGVPAESVSGSAETAAG